MGFLRKYFWLYLALIPCTAAWIANDNNTLHLIGLMALPLVLASLVFGLLLSGKKKTTTSTPCKNREPLWHMQTYELRQLYGLKTLAQYNQLLADLEAEKATFGPDTVGWSMTDLTITITKLQRDAAASSGMPYASSQDIANAMDALGFKPGTKPQRSDVVDAAATIRNRYDLASLKERGAPQPVLDTAQKRLEAANTAEVLLLGAPKSIVTP